MAKPAKHRSTSGHPELTAQLDDRAKVVETRRAVRKLAEDHGFAGRAGDLTLAFDELVANAREHGKPPIVVRAWYDGRVILEVTDRGEGFDYAEIARQHPPPMLGKRGRGIWIVRQVADHVRVRRGDAGTSVRVELTHEPHIGA